jgi:uncharacterized Zn finger protein
MANRDRPVKALSPFAAFLERSFLRNLAGGRSFERGEDYFLNGQVKPLANTRKRSQQRHPPVSGRVLDGG